MLRGESLRAFRHKIHVRTLTQNLSRRPHWIAQSLHASHAACAQRSAVHDQRIQLHLAVAIQKTSPAGVEGLVVFHDDDGFLDRIQRWAAALQHAPARGQRVAHAMQVRLRPCHRAWPTRRREQQEQDQSARKVLRRSETTE